MIGETFSHYKILSVLGQGGMGVVYKALDTRLRGPVALKFLPRELTHHKHSKKRLLNEARATFLLDHPNICNVHGIDETADGRLFICMTYYDGESLRERLSRGALDVSEAVSVAVSVAEGLSYAHARHVVHRDIKPGNLIVTTEHVVKVVDFGLAKLAGQTKVTRTGTTVGTVAYMSPEQVQGETVDARADIWSLGAVLYEMLTGRVPFHGDVEAAMLFSILNTEPESLEKLCPQAPRELVEIVRRALQKKPDDRYQRAGDLAADLRRVAVDAGWAVAPRATVIAVPKRSHRLAISLVAVLVFAVGVGFAVPGLRTRLGEWIHPAQRGSSGLAVLPFEYTGSDVEGRALAQGLMEMVRIDLKRIEAGLPFWVAWDDRVRRNDVRSADAAGRILGVQRVLSGRVERTGGGVKVVLFLDAPGSEGARQTAAVDFSEQDALSSRDTIVRVVARLLGVALDEDARARLRAGGTDEVGAFRSYVKALGYVRLARYSPQAAYADSAVSMSQRAIRIDDDFALAHVTLGDALRLGHTIDTAGRPEWKGLARESYRRATDLNPELFEPYLRLGDMERRARHYEEAISAFERALVLQPRSLETYKGLAKTIEKSGQFDRAEALLFEISDLTPDCWLPYEALGFLYYNADRLPLAAGMFQRALACAPDDESALNSLGAIHLLAGEWEEARKLLRRAFDIKPSCSNSINLATACYSDSRYADAARIFRFALHYCGDDDHELWANLASALEWVSGMEDSARVAYGRAIEIAEFERRAGTDDEPTLWCRLAEYYAGIKDFERAIAFVTRLETHGPLTAETTYRIACVFEAAGRREEALARLADAKRNGFPIAVIEAEPALEELRGDVAYRELIHDAADETPWRPRRFTTATIQVDSLGRYRK